jgi:hypothetical protein
VLGGVFLLAFLVISGKWFVEQVVAILLEVGLTELRLWKLILDVSQDTILLVYSEFLDSKLGILEERVLLLCHTVIVLAVLRVHVELTDWDRPVVVIFLLVPTGPRESDPDISQQAV